MRALTSLTAEMIFRCSSRAPPLEVCGLPNHYKGQLIVPEFGFYGRDPHINLIWGDHLIAGVNYLDELPVKLRNTVLLITDKKAQSALFDDAELLAKYAGHLPDHLREDNEYNRYIRNAM